ncbi:MAG: chromosomal replication initiator protein DnaA [Patescibacteria group bacterium]
MQSPVWKQFLQYLEQDKEKHKTVLSILKQTDAEISKDNKITIHCHNGGVKMYLNTRVSYLENLLFSFSQVEYKVEITIDLTKPKRIQDAPLLEFKPSLDDLYTRSGLNPKYKFDNFAVSSSNQVAYAAAQAVSQSPGTAYNPLFLYGGVGVGKTHLAQSIVRYILEKNSEKKTFFCPGDQFTNEFIESIRAKSGEKFRRKYRNFNILILDDIQFIAGKEKVQEEFFHTFNEIVSSGGQIILTSDRPPSDIKNLEDRLRSRFSGGLIVDIGEPDFELRTAIILIKAQEKNIEIDIEGAKIIAEHIEDTRALEGTLVSIYAQIVGKKESIEQEDVENYFSGKKSEKVVKKISPNDIVKSVCIYYNIKQSYIKGPSRVEHIALARQIIMYLFVKELGMKLTDAAFFLKRRDHTTVIHARDKIDHLLMTDENFKEQVVTIIKSLHSST